MTPTNGPEPKTTKPTETEATMPEPANTTPETTLGFSYEYGVDIYDEGTSKWQPVRFATAINPTVSAKEEDGATYDDHGADHPIRTGETVQLEFSVQQHRMADGNFLPEVELLLAAAGPDGKGGQPVKARYYDKPVNGTPNPKEAYEITCTVSAANRSNTGNNGIGGWSFTLKGQGARKRITNPATTPQR